MDTYKYITNILSHIKENGTEWCIARANELFQEMYAQFKYTAAEAKPGPSKNLPTAFDPIVTIQMKRWILDNLKLN